MLTFVSDRQEKPAYAFIINYAASSWASAALWADRTQEALQIPQGDRVNLRQLAEAHRRGVSIVEISKALFCQPTGSKEVPAFTCRVR